MLTVDYNKIPEEMRWNKQWCLSGPDDTGVYKAPHGFGPNGIFRISPTQDYHLMDLETAIEAAELYKPCGIGFILKRNDNFTCIDLDVKNVSNEPDSTKWTGQEAITRYWTIIKAFDSYTERSASGQGFHVWVHGKIGAGCKRDGVEVYSQERFIVCTGDAVVNKEIEERQELLEILVAEIRNAASPKIQLIDREQTESDETIFERARTADNAEKFITLCNGDWNGYPSQSEADLALMSIFTFYSKSNAQCRRMFRSTKLGERPKATKNDRYLNETLRTIRSREAREELADEAAAQASAEILASIQAQIKEDEALIGEIDPLSALEPEQEEGPGLAWPPGMVGAIAQYIFEGAPRPVKEVAIVSALGMMAGICGKAFNIPQSGLNIYLVLVAKSAIGKEAMHSGIANLLAYLGSAVPPILTYVDFADYASGPALSKAVAGNQSFVNVSGEWGRKLRRLATEDGRDGPMQQLRTVMTNLYQKSGPKSIVGGIGYSDKEKNVASVSGVAYSMIGESTPNTFYDALTESMMEDGFLSRFTVVEYTGSRPAANTRPAKPPHQMLFDALCSLVTHASDLNGRCVTQEVLLNPEANRMMNDFDKECDDHINNSEDEGYRQMWNRAHLKAYRIAALLACADNHTNPMITAEHAVWSLDLIRRDIAVMSRRISSGDVGIGDAPRERKVLALIQRYLKAPLTLSYGVPDEMRQNGVVPRKYLQICTQRSTAFTSHRNGQNAALDATIKSLIDSGYLVEMTKDKAFNQFGFQGKCYRIITLPLNSMEEKEIKTGKRKT